MGLGAWQPDLQNERRKAQPLADGLCHRETVVLAIVQQQNDTEVCGARRASGRTLFSKGGQGRRQAASFVPHRDPDERAGGASMEAGTPETFNEAARFPDEDHPVRDRRSIIFFIAPEPEITNSRQHGRRRRPGKMRAQHAWPGRHLIPMADDLPDGFRRAAADPASVVLEGFHALKHALRFHATIERAITADPELPYALARSLAPDITARLRAVLEPVSAEAFTRAAGVGSRPPPETGVLAIARRPTLDVPAMLRARHAPVVLLERPTHPGNLGAVVRVAAAAGARGVLATGPLDPWHPACLRGSAGLHFALPVARIDDLPATSAPLFAIDPDGEQLAFDQLPNDAILLFGSERHGLSDGWRERAVRKIAIPMAPGVSSLNLATAVAVTLYAWRLGKAQPAEAACG